MKNLTIKQEKFCQLYVENGGNASEAYRGAYNAENMKEHTINCKASVMLKQAELAARICQLRAKHAERHNITVDFLTVEYLEIFNMAKKSRKLAEAKGVLDSLGKLHGLMVDKKLVNGNIEHNHRQEPVPATLEWVADAISRGADGEAPQSLPN